MTFGNEPGISIYGEFGVRHLGGLKSASIDDPFGAD